MISADKLKCWLFQPVDRVALQVPRALVASVLAALLDCVYMIFLVEACRWQPVSAAILSYLIGGILQYILCSVWVFPSSPGNKTVSFASFILLSLGGLGITWVVMALGAKLLLPYGASKFLALRLAFVWNFASRKFLLFNKKTAAASEEADAAKYNTPKDYAAWITTVAQATRTAPDLREVACRG